MESAYREPDNPLTFHIHAGLLQQLLKRNDIVLFTWEEVLRDFLATLPVNPYADGLDYHAMTPVDRVQLTHTIIDIVMDTEDMLSYIAKLEPDSLVGVDKRWPPPFFFALPSSPSLCFIPFLLHI